MCGVCSAGSIHHAEGVSCDHNAISLQYKVLARSCLVNFSIRTDVLVHQYQRLRRPKVYAELGQWKEEIAQVTGHHLLGPPLSRIVQLDHGLLYQIDMLHFKS